LSKKEVIFYENAYYVGLESCEYISDKGILRSDNGLVETSYPVGIKEIKADENNMSDICSKNKNNLFSLEF
jgi:hypothetical protein